MRNLRQSMKLDIQRYWILRWLDSGWTGYGPSEKPDTEKPEPKYWDTAAIEPIGQEEGDQFTVFKPTYDLSIWCSVTGPSIWGLYSMRVGVDRMGVERVVSEPRSYLVGISISLEPDALVSVLANLRLSKLNTWNLNTPTRYWGTDWDDAS